MSARVRVGSRGVVTVRASRADHLAASSAAVVPLAVDEGGDLLVVAG